LKDGTELQVFVAEVKKQIVGVAVIRCEEVNVQISALISSLCAQYVFFLAVSWVIISNSFTNYPRITLPNTVNNEK